MRNYVSVSRQINVVADYGIIWAENIKVDIAAECVHLPNFDPSFSIHRYAHAL
jgi:hypothetical protein